MGRTEKTAALKTWRQPLCPQQFDWLQVSVTSHCNAACAYCPHTVYHRHWQNRHLSLEVFRNLLQDLKNIRLIYLQGWGEPFLHPDFFSFVALAKQAGCQVGATTNATLLDEHTIGRIVEAGMDVLAFSLAGIGETHDIWRQGTRYQQVLGAIDALQECKRRLGKSTPRVHVAYMLLRSGLADLERLPEALQGRDVAQVVISTLDLVAAPELARESLRLATGPEAAEITRQLEEVTAVGARRGLTIHYGQAGAGGQAVCPENVLRAAVISPAGDVSPCVFTNVPVEGGLHYVDGKPHQVQSLFFGNIENLSLQDIWRQPAYRQFRRSRRRGKLVDPCRHCLKLMAYF
jgi:MoaA/NifB/PqqE/SkfB family radical SAM enzyme